MLEEALAHLPDDTARKIAEDNARRVFNFPRRP
jgi:predicted TIM-barrel fold metal-dependent hydrolase